jgi:hypothetical protein
MDSSVCQVKPSVEPARKQLTFLRDADINSKELVMEVPTRPISIRAIQDGNRGIWRETEQLPIPVITGLAATQSLGQIEDGPTKSGEVPIPVGWREGVALSHDFAGERGLGWVGTDDPTMNNREFVLFTQRDDSVILDECQDSLVACGLKSYEPIQ